jgi:hypothetical protein
LCKIEEVDPQMLAMTMLARVWIPSLVSTMLNHQQEESNIAKRSACNNSCPTYKPTSCTIATKVFLGLWWVKVGGFGRKDGQYVCNGNNIF